MINSKSNQPDNNNINLTKSFSDIVKEFMDIKGITQSDLVKESCLSKTTISRILRDSNDKGKGYLPTVQIVMAIFFGLKLKPDEAEKLFYYAFPSMSFMGEFLRKGLSIIEANEILYDNGLPVLGNIPE